MRRFSIGTACSVALLLACANALFAQDTTFVRQGARVKVKFEQETRATERNGAVPYHLDVGRLIGDVTGLESDTLVFLPEHGGTPLTIPYSKIHKIEVTQGKKGNALLGLAVGAGVGFTAGLVICKADAGAQTCGGEGLIIGDATGFVAVGAAAILGGIGAVVGALIKTERWKEAELPTPPPVALNIGKDGSVRLAFSLRL